MSKTKKIVKLEAIRYCLTGLIAGHAFKGKRAKALYAMRDLIAKLSEGK